MSSGARTKSEVPECSKNYVELSERDDDSGVSVSGNLSQSSNSSSGSGSEADGATTDVADGDNRIMNKSNKQNDLSKISFCEVQCKAEKLAQYIIAHTLGSKLKSSDSVEETLWRCVKLMTCKHEILFNGMMRRLQINEETAYPSFINVVNELFEGEQLIVNWGRIIALYAFGGQLALYCREKKLRLCEERIPVYVGRYAKEVVSSFVFKQGGWEKLCEEFPQEDDIDNKVWRLLAWTAVGLGLATAASFLASH